jgi:hypothetical protein
VAFITASPEEVPVGGEIDVSVIVAASEAGPLSYTWTATSGQFATAIAPKTRYSCTAVGSATLTVEVSGGEGPDGASCVQQRSTTVQCEPLPEASAAFPCPGSPMAPACTSTEQLFVTYDPTGACYSCLLDGGCIDDAPKGIAGNECDDLTGDAVGGPNAGAWKPSLCLMTVSCILQTACADPSVVDCYCGASEGGACGESSAANGACVVAENGGLETSSPADALDAFASRSLAAGVANAIFECAEANHCSPCFPKSQAATIGAEGADE